MGGTISADVSADRFRRFTCRGCGKTCVICRSCDRGNRYCSPECSTSIRRTTVRRASKRFQETPRGRDNHRKRQRLYRKKTQRVTHQGSNPIGTHSDSTPLISSACQSKCCRCGATSTGFARGTYLPKARKAPHDDIKGTGSGDPTTLPRREVEGWNYS